MSLAPPLIKVAKKLIKQFGRNVTLNTVTEGDYNPDTGTAKVITTSTINGFIGQYSTQELGNDSMIQAGDSPLYTTDALDKDDKVTIGGVVYSITMVTVYGVNDANILYVSNVRRL